MTDGIITDVDLQNNLAKVSHRIDYCTGLDCSEINQLCNSWKCELKTCKNELQKNELIYSLLTLKKAKNYWKQIQPSEDTNISPERFREQLSLAIAKFYSENSKNPKYHISFILEILSK